MKYLIFIVFIHINFISYSQKINSYNIEFNIKSKIKVKGPENTYSLNTLKANIITEHGDFSLILVDYNSNENYNDFGEKYEFISFLLKEKTPDGILISKYNSNNKTIDDGGINTLLLNTEFFFNGLLFSMQDLKKVSESRYSAKIVEITKNIDYKKAYDNYYLNFTDRLNHICVKKLKSNRKIDLRKKYMGKKLYIEFVHAYVNEFGFFDLNTEVLENFKPKNFNVIYVIAESKKESITRIKEKVHFKYPIYYIDENDYQNYIKIGSNFLPYGVFFDENGKLVDYNIFFSNEEQIKNLEND